MTNCVYLSHDYEYMNCKDGETTWRCRHCPETKIEYQDTGCGG